MSRGVVAFVAFAGAVLLMAAVGAGATQYSVGGSSGWAVPGAGAEPYNTWAEKTSFQIGDKLLFVYPKDTDSVLLVEAADYNACNTSSYDKRFDDGSTAFDLDRAGAFFFISGVDANCRVNEKLIVMVAAAATKAAPPPTQGSTTPTPAASSPPPTQGSTTPTPASSPPPSAPSGGQTSPSPPSPPKTPAAAANNSNSTARGAPPAAANGAGRTAARTLAGSFVACIGYAMLAV